MTDGHLERPIFVVGCPRSGTTLVQCILSASSQAFSLPETHFFSWVLPTLRITPETPVTPELLGHVRAELEYEAQLTLGDTWWGTLSDASRLTAIDVFLALVENYRPGPGLRAIEKTPRHVLHMELIGKVFPDAVFVNVVRDPIDVVSSLHAVPFESSRSVLSHAQRWLESVAVARAYASAHPGRLHTLVYEQLIRGPEACVRDLCDAVQLPYETAMLEEFGAQAARNVTGSEPWKRDVASGVIVDRSGVWRTRMRPGEAWLVAQATRRQRLELGYPTYPGTSGAQAVGAMLREARVRFHEARASAGFVGAARHAGSAFRALAPA